MGDGRRRAAAALLAAATVAGCSRGPDRPLARARTPTTAAAPTTEAPAPTTPALPVATAPGCPPIPRRPPPWAERPRYDLRVDVRPAESVVTGEVGVHFTPDLPTDRLVFRLWPNGPRPARAGARLDTGQVLVDGRPSASALESPTVLVVPLGRALAAGQAVDVRMPWQLRLPGPNDDRVSRNGDAVRLGSFFPILPWEPGVGWAVDPPTPGFAEASTAPVADFVVSVAVPQGLSVLASGAGDGNGTWKAIAMRDFALSVGRFTTARATVSAPEPVEVTVGVQDGAPGSPAAFLQKAAGALEDYGRRFGPYPWPTYSLAITPGLGGGIEYPAHVMQGPGTLGRTTSHEAAHMWFYGLVGNDQGRDPWLDEGLATWAEWRHEGTLAAHLAETIPAVGRGRAGEPMTFWDTTAGAYFPSVYNQTAQALGALGDPDLVDCGLRLFAAVNAQRIARPADLVGAMGAVFPDAAETLGRYGLHS